jgi:oligopeptide transport system permease protein
VRSVSVLVGVELRRCCGLLRRAHRRRMMRLVDVLYSIPFLFVVIFVITLL